MKKISLFIIALGVSTFSMAQTADPQLVSTSGASFSNGSYQLDWSIGEVVTATHTEGNYTLTQGFHQDKYTVVSVEDLAIEMNVSVYPNPTTDFVTLNFQDAENIGANSGLTLTDMNGKIILQENITETEKQLDFSNYSPGIYFITVTESGKKLKNFKIIKK